MEDYEYKPAEEHPEPMNSTSLKELDFIEELKGEVLGEVLGEAGAKAKDEAGSEAKAESDSLSDIYIKILDELIQSESFEDVYKVISAKERRNAVIIFVLFFCLLVLLFKRL